MIVIQLVKEFLLDKVGQGYIYGAKGQTCSPAFRQQQAQQYPEQADYILGVGEKWDGVPVWDCAQLTRFAAKVAGVTLPSGATSQWTKVDWLRKGTIDTLPENEPVFLYRRQNGSSTVMAHTGFAMGDGTCIHARGTAYGVVRQDMADYAWTHWATPWEANGGGEVAELATLYKGTLTAAKGNTVNIRRSPGGTVLARWAVGVEVDVVNETTDGWVAIKYDGGTAYVDAEFVKKQSAGEETVNVSLPRNIAAALRAAFEKALEK